MAGPDLVRFATRILKDWPEGGVEMDGGELQDLAVECGLLVPEVIAAPCGTEPYRYCFCEDEGATFPRTCYRRVPLRPGTGSPGRSYDDKQAGAVRTQCTVCLRWFDMTTPAAVCIECKRCQ